MLNHCFRVGSGNIDNLPLCKGEPKNDSLFQAIINFEIDQLMLQETGVNWSVTAGKDQFQQRLNEYFEPDQTSSYMSHNQHDKTGNRKQWGGTGTLTHGKLKHFGMGAGTDKAQLGRWTWARFRGKGGIVFCTVSMYQPCTNKNGEQSVYAQHKSHLQTLNDDRDPRKAFMEDLKMELTEWIDQGDQIVVGGDMNESVFHESITSLFDTFNMRNLIFDMHDPAHAPKSYFRTTEGRIVDGLWGTPGIHVERCGYLEPGDFPGNHSLMWADITYESALGHNPPFLNVPPLDDSAPATPNAPNDTSTTMKRTSNANTSTPDRCDWKR